MPQGRGSSLARFPSTQNHDDIKCMHVKNVSIPEIRHLVDPCEIVQSLSINQLGRFH